jgi:GxxExxY protein
MMEDDRHGAVTANQVQLQTKLLYKDEVYAIIGAAIEVHRELGSGFLEAVYQEALEIELEQRGVPFEAQRTLPIFYKQRRLKREYIADVVCHDKIIVELKALDKLSSRETAQLLNYLKATGLRVGLLINFGSIGTLEWERLVK